MKKLQTQFPIILTLLSILALLFSACGNVTTDVQQKKQITPTRTVTQKLQLTPTRVPSRIGMYTFRDSSGECVTDGVRADSVKEVILQTAIINKNCAVIDTKDPLYGSKTPQFATAIQNDKTSITDGKKVYPFTPIAFWLSQEKGGIPPTGFQQPGPYNFEHGGIQVALTIAVPALAQEISVSILLKDEQSRNYESPQYNVHPGPNILSLMNIGHNTIAGGDGDFTDVICIEVFVRIYDNKAYSGGGIIITNVEMHLSQPA